MKSITDIIKGHMNEFSNENEELYKERIKICRECPLFKMTKMGPICNPLLYLDVEINRAFATDGPNRQKGCGCRLNAKTRLEDATCPNNKW